MRQYRYFILVLQQIVYRKTPPSWGSGATCTISTTRLLLSYSDWLLSGQPRGPFFDVSSPACNKYSYISLKVLIPSNTWHTLYSSSNKVTNRLILQYLFKVDEGRHVGNAIEFGRVRPIAGIGGHCRTLWNVGGIYKQNSDNVRNVRWNVIKESKTREKPQNQVVS